MRFDPLKNPAAFATDYIPGCSPVKMGEETFLASTDGKALLMIAATADETDHPERDKVYPAAAFDVARKAGKRVGVASIALNGTARVVCADSVVEHQPLDRRFPDAVHVIPKGKAEFSICLDAEHLAIIAKALGVSGVRLTFYGDNVPLKVEQIVYERSKACKPRKDSVLDGSFGVLMPIAGH